MKGKDAGNEPVVQAFCSYVHRDNESFGFAIERLVEDIKAFHEAETGRPMRIFFDRDDIGWGQDLRSAISDSVENATFFIPMITARYFQSSFCRDELLSFYGKCRSLGVTELILPVILAGSSQIREDSDDELIRVISRINYVNWSDTWQTGRGSAAWSTGVTQLVRRLVVLEERVENHLARTLAESPHENNNGSKGIFSDSGSVDLDEVSDADQQGQAIFSQVRRITDNLMTLLTELESEFGRFQIADDFQIRSALDRLGVRYADRGHAVAQEARSVLDELVEYDAQVRAVIRMGRQLATEDGLALVDKQVTALREVAPNLGDSIRRVDAMSDVLRKYSDVSVRLRLAMSPIRAALQTLRDIARILDGWLAINY